MNEFDSKAAEWDNNPEHWERSLAITNQIRKRIPLEKQMIGLEYGAGTGIASFMLKEHLKEITLMDNSSEMVKVIHQKRASSKSKNLKPLLFDLEHGDYHGGKFDFIFSQMVLHHVSDIRQLLHKFYQLLNSGGYLAIADMYAEDGSFHGNEFTGHKGFNVEDLQDEMGAAGFKQVATQPCYTIKKTVSNTLREYPVFLMTSRKQAI
jgi:tRNA (cmo5U34)-methyltransferase